jgi:hypothetical protein
MVLTDPSFSPSTAPHQRVNILSHPPHMSPSTSPHRLIRSPTRRINILHGGPPPRYLRDVHLFFTRSLFLSLLYFVCFYQFLLLIVSLILSLFVFIFIFRTFVSLRILCVSTRAPHVSVVNFHLNMSRAPPRGGCDTVRYRNPSTIS